MTVQLSFAHAATIAAASLMATGPTLAEDIKSYRAGFWQGGAQVDTSGKMFDCYMRAQNIRDGYVIFLRYDTQGVHLTLMDDSWSLPAGDSFRGRIQVDRRFDKDLPGNVLSPSIVDYVFGHDESGWDAIRKGTAISIEGPAGTKKFQLTGTSKAMNRLFDCADEFYGNPEDVARSVVPVAPTAAPAPAQAQPAAPLPPKIASDDPIVLIRRAVAIASGQEDGSPEEAYALAEKAASMGDRQGHWLTGRFALAGYGVEMPRDQALARILLAAEEGHAEAQTFLAFEYLQSNDPVRALVGKEYLNRAAAQGHSPAIAALRMMKEGTSR